MSQRVELIISAVNDTREAIEEIKSSFQSFAAKFAVWNYSFQAAWNGARKALDVAALSTARVGDELLKMSQKTGIGVEELYRLKSVAELSNVGLGEMTLAIGALSRNLAEAKEKAGDARMMFNALGIETAQPLNQILRDLAKSFSEIEDGEDKMVLAMQIFGRSGADIIPVLNDIARGAQDVSVVFDNELAKASGELMNNFTQLKQEVEKVSIAIGRMLIPALNQMFHDIQNGVGPISFLIQQFRDMFDAATWLLSPVSFLWQKIHEGSQIIGNAVDSLLGYNQALSETQRLIKNAPTNASQLEFAFPPEYQDNKKPAPRIIADEQRRKFVDNEQNMVEIVDKAGQEIIDSLNRREKAYRDYLAQIQSAREAEISLQLKQIDLAEQEFKISKSDAIQRRVELYRELKRIQEEYLVNLDKEKDPASWYAQINAINETREALIRLNLELKKQTGTFTEGAKFGFQEYIHNAKTAFEYGTDMARAAAGAMEDFFSNISFDAMQGKLKSLGDYFKNFLMSIQQAISQILAQLIVRGIISGISGFFAPLAPPIMVHQGGYIPRFHIGGLAYDEVPAILQRGEYVVSRKGVDMLDRINSGQPFGETVIVQQTVQFNVSAIDGRDTDRFFRENEGRIKEMVSRGIRSSRNFSKRIREA